MSHLLKDVLWSYTLYYENRNLKKEKKWKNPYNLLNVYTKFSH